MANVRVRSWRAAFSRLREETASPLGASTLLENIFTQSKTLIAAAPDLPPEEVVEDILFLIQLVSSEPSFLPDLYDIRTACSKVCCLIMDMNSRACLGSVRTYVPSVLHFVETLIQTSSSSMKDMSLEQEPRMKRSKYHLEYLEALGQIVQDYGDQLSSDDVTRVITLLLDTIKRAELALLGTLGLCPKGTDCGSTRTIMETMESQRLVFVVLGNVLARSGNSISSITWLEVFKTLRDSLEALTTGGQLVEDIRSSRFYAGILRCLQLSLSDLKVSIAEHVARLVTVLQQFLVYGLKSSHHQVYGTPSMDDRIAEENGKAVPTKTVYRPPHLRRSLNKSICHGPQRVLENSHCVGSGGVKTFSSDSEQSDSDGSIGDEDRFRSSKTRASAILCIQALARADPKALHAHWILLLPTHDILNWRRSQATLLNTVLFDPILKVRMAAASTISLMLEGPSRAFMQVAEYRESAKLGSFMTLSCSLGQILLQLQRGLAYLTLNERNIGILVASLKALSLFIAAAPFPRLPDELLPNTIQAVQKRIKSLLSSSTDQMNAVCMALGCLGCALNTTPASPHVAMMLSEEVSGNVSGFRLLQDLLECTNLNMPSLVCVEALQVLKFAVRNYPSIMVLYWTSISSTIRHLIQNSSLEHSMYISSTSFTLSPHGTQTMADERVVYAAVKLLDEFLRAVSGSRITDELQDDHSLQSTLQAQPTEFWNMSSAAASFDKDSVGEHENFSEVAGLSYWDEILQDYLPLLLKHSAALVRGGSITCFAGLTYAIFSALPDRKKNLIFSTVLEAVLQDETPSVRSAACRAIGVLISFPKLVARDDVLTSAIDVIIVSTGDVSVAVRITASWALANICDALRSAAESSILCHVRSTTLTALAECAIKLSKDGDKVRANAVRALGNLARFVSFGGKNAFSTRDKDCVDLTSLEGTAESFPWIERMVQTLVSCVTTGNVKVQWNVCHALGNLFLNKSISLPEMTWAASVFSILLLLLRDSANFKIRIQAASALSVPESRGDYGGSFHDVIQALALAVDSLDSYQIVAPSCFKYMNALNEQLTATFIHVLGLAAPEDYDSLQEFLLKRRSFFEGWLKTAYYSAPQAATTGCQFQDTAHDRNTSSHLTRCSTHREKLMPPPKERIWYALNDKVNVTCRNETLYDKKEAIKRVTERLTEMYRYGNQKKAALLFGELLEQFAS